MAQPPEPWLVGFWSRPALNIPKTGYLFCGIQIGPRQVLTVKHDLAGRQQLFARLVCNAADKFKVVDRHLHPTLDAAILTLGLQPDGARVPDWAPERMDLGPGRLVGVFEGVPHECNIAVGRADPQWLHHLFTPEQPKGVSGGAVLVSGKLWGMAVRRYGDEGIGCAIPMQLLRGWIRAYLQTAGVDEAIVPAAAVPVPVASRLSALARWLDAPAQSALKHQLIAAAEDANSPPLPAEPDPPQPAAALEALQRIAHHRTPTDVIAGIHLLGRALRLTRVDMGDADYHKHIQPRAADLLAQVVAAAFDCDCTVLPPTADQPTSRVRRTPFHSIGINALLAAQLFKGRLQFTPANGGWQPQWLFELHAPPNGEKPEQALFREAHRRLVGGETTDTLARSRESAPLDAARELHALRRRISEQVVENQNLVAFVDCSSRLQLTPAGLQRAEAFAAALDVDMLLQCPADDAPVLRMRSDDFEDAMTGFLSRHAAPAPTR